MSQVTRILTAIEHGDPNVVEELLPLVYDELRRLASAKLAREPVGQTLQPTALVHDAYLRLIGDNRNQPDVPAREWHGRRHFFAAAVEAMRRILVERARQRAAVKHGGQLRRIELDKELVCSEERSEELLALDEALTDLETHDEPAARLVKLRYFGGLSHQEAAEAMGVTRRAADRLWVLARAWLFQRLRETE